MCLPTKPSSNVGDRTRHRPPGLAAGRKQPQATGKVHREAELGLREGKGKPLKTTLAGAICPFPSSVSCCGMLGDTLPAREHSARTHACSHTTPMHPVAHVHTRTNTHVRTCSSNTHARSHVYKRVHARTHTLTYTPKVHTRIDAHTRIHVCEHTHMLAHTQRRLTVASVPPGPSPVMNVDVLTCTQPEGCSELVTQRPSPGAGSGESRASLSETSVAGEQSQALPELGPRSRNAPVPRAAHNPSQESWALSPPRPPCPSHHSPLLPAPLAPAPRRGVGGWGGGGTGERGCL